MEDRKTIAFKAQQIYENKIILAPMVRIGTLPMRLLALNYGADIVYTQELIDYKLQRSYRRENDVLGTVDYIDKTDGTVVFRTCASERDKVVLQIGTCDAQRALEVAKMMENDVAAVDINMGCPKAFSILGGMGAALLSNREKAKDILSTLVNGLSIPVSCKIRVLPDLEQTLELCEMLASIGISAIAVHGRTVQERPQHANRNEVLKKISNRLSIPVIGNGGSRDIQSYSDILRFKEITGCTSVMIARAAEWNCSVFRKGGPLPVEDVIKAYLKIAVDYDNSPSNTKYCVQNILRELQETPQGRKFLDAQSLEQICDIWGLADYCRLKGKLYREKGLQGRFQAIPANLNGKSKTEHASNKRKLYEEEAATLLCCAFMRNTYTSNDDLPKTQLINWTREQRKKLPSYETWQEDRLFRSLVTVDGRRYGSSFWEKNKKWAEQGAALVCLCSLGIIDVNTLATDGKLPS